MREDEGMWVHDFFWTSPESNSETVDKIHDCGILGIKSFNTSKEVLIERVLRTRCVKWLIFKLRTEPENELHFGKLTRILHDELLDDPTPYRKDIKSLLQNLLQYVEEYLPDVIEITSPNYSQKIKLISK